MASVPARLIATAPIYWESEAIASLGGSINWCGVSVPPVTLGSMTMLEFLDSRFVSDFTACRAIDVLRAVTIFRARADALPWVAQWVEAGKPEGEDDQLELDRQAMRLPVFNPDFEGHARLRIWYHVAFAGYQMIPPGESEPSAWLFGAPTIGATVANLGAAMGVPWRELVWETPLTLLGFAVAAMARQNGAKGVSRPKDRDDIKRQLEAAKARELAGDLHPWQEAEPLVYPLSGEQRKHPEAVERYRVLVEAAREKTKRSRVNG